MTSWDDETSWLVHTDDPEVAVSNTVSGRPRLILRYLEGEEGREDGVPMCDRTRPGVVCRMWKGHPGPCIPFAEELVQQSGVYILEVEER